MVNKSQLIESIVTVYLRPRLHERFTSGEAH